jgi:negative regulator of flagellin synthesis FlgM
MSSIDTRSAFFPNKAGVSSTESTKSGNRVANVNGGNAPEKTQQINERTGADAKVSIPEGVKDFSKIKKAAMSAPEQDNTDKIAKLKAQIQAGTYEIDYDGLADKILQSEF